MKAPIAYMWAAQHSQIYPELARLAEAGLITSEVIAGRGPRDTKLYTLTPAGRDALARWSDSPLAPEVPRLEMLLRVRALWLVDRERAVAFVQAQREVCVQRLAVLAEERNRFDQAGVAITDQPEFFAWATLQYGIARTETTLEWCDWLLEQLAEPRATRLEVHPRPPTERTSS